MKKYTILALALILCSALFVGCGCSGNVNTTTNPTTVPTSKPTTVPTTEMTTAPTTHATTAPTETTHVTEPSMGATDATNGTIHEEGTAATDNARSRTRHPGNPMG